MAAVDEASARGLLAPRSVTVPTPAPTERKAVASPPTTERRSDRRLAHLVELRAERDSVARAIEDEVGRLRRSGVAWPQIGAALGVSRQAVRQKYGVLDHVGAERP